MIDSNNKRLAKNTIILYFRMIITMIIGLFTSRVVLSTLGVEDYGINNIVGGFVSMFTFLNATLTSGTQRFLTYALGENDFNKQKATFSTTFIIHLFIGIVIAFIIITIGFSMMKKLNIPDYRMDAAEYVFICSTITVILGITQVPYTASIVAHENMKIYAYMTIFDSLAKLIIAYSLLYAENIDKLKLYAVLLLLFSVINLLIYRIYCIKKYPECKFSFIYDKKILKSIMSFSGWNIMGTLAVMGSGHGVNIVLNLFFGPIINTARAISVQVNSLAMNFVGNFLTALNPQIVKYHASQEYKKLNNLIYNSSKFSGLLTLYVIIPLSVEIKFLLYLWLGEYPKETIYFTQIILLQSLVTTLTRPIIIGLHATGNLKWSNILSSSILLLIVPVTYFLLKINTNIYIVLLINVIPWLLECLINSIILRRYIGFSFLKFYKSVYLPIILLTIICYIILISIYPFISNEWIRLISLSIINTIILSALIFFIVLSKTQKEQVIIKTRNYFYNLNIKIRNK